MISKSHKKQEVILTEPSISLAEEYFRNAEETLRITNLIKDSGSNMWLATQKYYTEYLAAYSILMKIGIKSEVHTRTIDIIKLLEQEKIIDFQFSNKLEEDKNLRIDNQYYLKNIPIDFDPKKTAELLLKVRNVLDTLSKEKIEYIRRKLQQ